MPIKKLNLSSFGEDCSVPSRSRRRRLGLGLGVSLAAINLGHPAAAQFVFPGFPPPPQRAPACPDLLRRPDVAAFTRQFVRQNEDGQDIPDQVLATYRRELAAYLQVQLRPADFARVQGFVANLPTPTIALCVPQVMALANGSAYAANRPPGGPRDPMRSDTNNLIAEQQRDRAAQEQLRQSRIDAASQTRQAGQQDLAGRLAAEDAELDARRKAALARETARNQQIAAANAPENMRRNTDDFIAEQQRDRRAQEEARRTQAEAADRAAEAARATQAEERKARAERDAEEQRQAAARQQAEQARRQAAVDSAAADKQRQDAAPLTPLIEGVICPDWVHDQELQPAIHDAAKGLNLIDLMDNSLTAQRAFEKIRDRLVNAVLEWPIDRAFQAKSAAAIKVVSRKTLSSCFPTVGTTLATIEIAIDRAAKQRAFDATAQGKLLGAYEAYVVLSRCFDSRRGYALVYLTSQELAQAKQQVGAIEKTVVASEPSLDLDSIWNDANKPASARQETGLDNTLFPWGEKAIATHEFSDSGKFYCGKAAAWLNDAYAVAQPNAPARAKDF